MDPQQELFTELKLKIESLGYDVYDGSLPAENTPYPFVYLADSWQNDTANKTAIHGYVTQTIHVWHNDTKQRGTVSEMMLGIKQTAYKLEHSNSFAWNIQEISQRIISDNTTKEPLLHGILTVKFYFS